MDRVDIVPVQLRHPDPIYQEVCADSYNVALCAVFAPGQLETPALDLSGRLIQDLVGHEAKTVSVVSAHPEACSIFFELTTIDMVYVALEAAARKVQAKIVWHEMLTLEQYLQTVPSEPILGILLNVIAQQPV